MLQLPFLESGAPLWDWWLVNSSDMSQIGQLNAHSRSLQLQLDSPGKASCWVHLFDDIASEVALHQTGLRLDRNGETVWSGEIFQSTDSSSAQAGQEEGEDQLQITAMGWFQDLNQRELHTGAEFQAMLIDPHTSLATANYLAWSEKNGPYIQLGIDTAIQLAYDVIEFPQTSDAAIMLDLLARANIDVPTHVTAGTVYGAPIGRNLTLQRFQNIGEQIVQLCNVESGCDFYIDPVTRQMNLYGPEASSSPSIPNGLGQDRGLGTIFTYPGNCTSAQRPRDGTRTANRFEAIGQYSVGRQDDLASQAILGGLYEASQQLPEVVDPNILAAFASAEVAVRSFPWTIITFTPRGVTATDESVAGVPRPFEDFNIGDLVYTQINRGCFQVGTSGMPQDVRVFGFTLSIDDNGVEKLTQIQTTYQGAGAP